MTFQLDIKPSNDGRIHLMNMYIDGYCYPVMIQADYVYMMQRKGVVKQVKGRQRIGEKIVEIDYPENVDSAGVQYTSQELKVIENN
ncbi:MAG: hypothetical protein JST26_04760 [Bacteroidetes bacterium]|nr:hypothetical protein [Bacteroidota bacterium]